MALHFSKEEFSNRKTNVLKSMKEQNLNALLMFKQESMYWLTGYDTFGFVFFQSLILRDDGEIILLTRAPDLRQAQNTSVIKDIRIWVDKDKSNPENELKNILSELGLEKSNLGVEYEAYGLTGRNAIRLNNSIKNFATLHDKSELISFLRVVKSPTEIVYVKKAAELADKAMDAAWKYAHAGQNESKILAEIGYIYHKQSDKWTILESACDYIYIGNHLLEFNIPGTLKIINNYTKWIIVCNRSIQIISLALSHEFFVDNVGNETLYH